MKIDNIPVIGKSLIVLIFFGLLVVGGTVYTTNKMRVIDDTYSDLTDHNALSSIMLSRSRAEMLAIRSAIGLLLIAESDAGNKEALDQIASARRDLIKFNDAASAALPIHAAEYDALKQSVFRIIDKDCAETIRLGSATVNDSVLQSQKIYLQQCAPAFPAIMAAYKTAVDTNIAEAKVINDATTDVTNATILTTWAIMLGGLVLAMGAGFFAIRAWIAKPLGGLGALMTRLAGGELDVVVTGIDRKDEIGGMARVVQIFKSNAEAKRLFDNFDNELWA